MSAFTPLKERTSREPRRQKKLSAISDQLSAKLVRTAQI
jgi:hypothetical protein